MSLLKITLHITKKLNTLYFVISEAAQSQK